MIRVLLLLGVMTGCVEVTESPFEATPDDLAEAMCDRAARCGDATPREQCVNDLLADCIDGGPLCQLEIADWDACLAAIDEWACDAGRPRACWSSDAL